MTAVTMLFCQRYGGLLTGPPVVGRRGHFTCQKPLSPRFRTLVRDIGGSQVTPKVPALEKGFATKRLEIAPSVSRLARNLTNRS